MKKHVYSELIKAWADGAQIQYRVNVNDAWEDLVCTPSWGSIGFYRVKPESKPDSVVYVTAVRFDDGDFDFDGTYKRHSSDNLKLTFDGETGALKAAEVLV
jgi:hypothetical protein